MPHYTRPRFILILFTLLSFVFCVVDSANAQKPAAAANFNDQLFNNQWHSTTNAKQLVRFLNMRIEQMKLVCDLDESQVKKLSLAGTSVARKLSARKDKRVPLGAFFNDDQPLEVQEDSLSDEDAESNDKGAAKGGKQFTVIPTVSKLSEIEEDPTWKKVVLSVLSNEQNEGWAEFLSQQKNDTRKELVRRRVLELKRELCLVPDQIKPVTEVIDKVLGDELVSRFELGPVALGMPQRQKSSKISDQEFQGILNDAQMEVWKNRDLPNGKNSVVAKALGINFDDDATPSVQLGVTFADTGSLEVATVSADSLAEALGVEAGDVIDSFNDVPVDSRLQLTAAIKASPDVITIEVIRNGASIVLREE